MDNAYFGRLSLELRSLVGHGNTPAMATLSDVSVNHLGALGNSLTIP